ncbi:sensor histidine kinase [Caldimonas thermodepolymerans]|uniref:Two-component sensor histidine kinase n=2 Tax=Caldimonas thermodepolymerans TaxID=215580 RepID=A0A2S5T3R4_9BURK|nr:sensor histidine kinase [Caldimonas thermodepolymerans]PPE69623.1 two-component sensor histidine kinase [Caldimonas thermodepolymerans]UZG44757.1 sensor histidine kinase [Caldimonas thermodepolymerans]
MAMDSASSSPTSRWQALVARLKAARREVEVAAARSGQVPATLLRRFAVLRLAVPITLLLGGALLWFSEQGYQRLERVYADVRQARTFTEELNNLSFVAARVDATRAEYLLGHTPESLHRHRATLREVVAARSRLAAAMADGAGAPGEMAVVWRYIDAEDATLRRLDALPGGVPTEEVDRLMQPNPVSDGALREALGRLVGRERERLERAELAAAVEVQRQRWWSLIAIAAAVLLLILLFQTYRTELDAEQRMAQRLQQERDRLERAVRRRTRELSELATHLQHLAEAEKSRLARELHDELGAILTASKMDVGMLLRRGLEPRETALATLQRLQEMLERGVQVKRRVIEGLVPTTLRNLGLAAALEALAEEVEASSGLVIERRIPEELPLDDERGIAAYRIVQEALTNVQKHAQATRVELDVALGGEVLRLRVRDDGVGIGSSTRSERSRLKSHGLRGMKHRVDAFHGRFDLRTAPQGGTELLVELPLHDVGDDEGEAVDDPA